MGIPIQKLTGRLLLAALFILPVFSAAGEELIFRQVTGDEEIIYRNTITPRGEGFFITLETEGEYNECELDQDLSVLTWRILRPAEGTDILFERRGSVIDARGKREDRVFRNTFKIDNAPWFQFHELTMSRFGVSQKEHIRFWTIDRRTMDIVKFKAEKLGGEKISAGGKTYDALKVELSLTGFAGILGWHSYFWLRSSDGRYLRLEAPGIRSSDPDSIVELMEENS